MLLDWKLFLDTSLFTPLASMNGEAVVYGQVRKKVVWHAVVLHSADMNAPDAFAARYVDRGAPREIWARSGLGLMAAANGAKLVALDTGQNNGAQYNPVVSDRRPDEPGGGGWHKPACCRSRRCP